MKDFIYLYEDDDESADVIDNEEETPIIDTEELIVPENIQNLLNDLNITDVEPIENENGSYTIDIIDSNEYSKYFSKLEKADFIEEDDEASQVTADTSTIQYINDDFVITLMADLDNDTYKMVIRETEE